MKRLALGAVAAALALPASASGWGWPNYCRIIVCDAPASSWTTANWVIIDQPVQVHHHHRHHHRRVEPEDGD